MKSTNGRRASVTSALLLAGVLTAGLAQAALASAGRPDGPEINRINAGGSARDLTAAELAHVNRARGIVPSR